MVGWPPPAPPEPGGEYIVVSMSTQRIHNRKSLKDLRRHLRHSLTPAEATLWKALQGSKLAGKKFRRQHSIGNYVVDFYCPECKLAIELDGEKHFNSMASEYDLRRMEFLAGLNICVLRFENRAVFENPEGVLKAIRKHVATNATTPDPS